MIGINFGDGVKHIARRIWVAASRQGVALDGEAFFDVLGEKRARLQKQEVLVKVAKRVFGFEVQIDFGNPW